MEEEKGKGGEYSEYPPPGKGLGESQLTKRVYCYCKWMSASRRFSSGESTFPGLGPPTVLGVRGGFGVMGLWGLFSMGMPPALLIHLDCDAETELKRIRARAREIEESIDLDFLDTLNKAVGQQVRKVQGNIRIITINSAIKNFADDEKTKEEISKYIAEIFSQ